MSNKNHNLRLLFLGICFWTLLLFTSESKAQTNSVSFNHVDISNGLSNNTVLSITQDSTGFMWFGTKYGLNRFDGRTFKVFKNAPQDKASLSSTDLIRTLIVSKNNTLWVQSSSLDLYHSKDDSFETIIPQKEQVLKILQDKKGNLWIGTKNQLKLRTADGKKIIPINIAKKKIVFSELFEDNENHIWAGTSDGLFELFFDNKKLIIKRHLTSLFNNAENTDYVNSIIQDHNSKYWIGTKKNGIYLYNKKTSQVTHFFKNNNDKNSLINNNVRKILFHKNGSIWIGTQDGLSILNPINKQFTNYQHDPSNPNSLSQNSIYDIFQDKNGSVWIATYFGGVNVVYSANTPFSIFQNDITKNSISSNIVSAIAEDNKSNLWIGTEAGGLNYFDRSSQQFTKYKNNSNNKNSLSSNLIKAIAIDKDQNLWIGTGDFGGLNFFNPKTSTVTTYKHTENTNSISSDAITSLVINKQNILFIGTDSGLNTLDIKQQKFSFIDLKGKTFIDNSILTLLEDKKGSIWIGTYSGIHLYKNSRIQHINLKDSLNKPFNYTVNCFLQDSQGNMWAGTSHNGLALLNLKNKSFTIFDSNNGLPSDNISGIIEDNDLNLWISTDNGLVKYNLQSKNFRTFNMLDGLPDNQFNTNSVLKDKQGQLFFGTFNGLVQFMPKRIEKNKIAPDVVFSNLKLFNTPVKIKDENGILNDDINYSKSLTFNHNQNNFTIEFSALNFIKSNKNKYAYKLDGLEKNWNYVDNPSATYINIPAGQYQFLVKAANNDGVWSKNIKKIDIVILPPVWKTWWAYLIYSINAFAIAFYISKFLKAKANLQQELHFEKMKLDFFTNISHEIRTPLTLILGPIEKIEHMTPEHSQVNKYAISVKNNANRLYRLVNELLDFRKVDSGNMRLLFSEEDIVSELKEVFDYFQTLAESKNIQYNFINSDPQILVYFDKNQMEKVFFNLLSNAFKFTQNNGIINVEITLIEKEQQVKITVTDNGKGVNIEDIDDIFKNYFQSGQNMGTGIGLSLTKSLVELHKGTISVTSQPTTETETGKTAFTVILQLGKNHLNEREINVINTIENSISEEVVDYATENFIDPPTISDKDKIAKILIVEDNEEVREFIKQSLKNQYQVYESEHGLDGWQNATKMLPDLIICDVMMPIMDGLELCKKLKTDVRTSHIPVIMLTAKSAPIHQIQGLQHGADAYITKPFSDQILQLNIRNLLALKTALQKKYSELLLQLPIISNEELSQEEIFLQKLHRIIEDNISNVDLNISLITSEIGMSRAVLYKKFSALTDLTLNDYIKKQRLKHAVELFQKGESSTLYVSEQVGFNNAKYFNREFKKVYGISPSEYIKTKGQTGEPVL